MRLMTKSAQAVARKYWARDEASDQVRKLSLQLFDAARPAQAWQEGTLLA